MKSTGHRKAGMSFFIAKKQILLVIVVVGIALAGIAAHIHLGAREDATGALAVLDHIFDLTLALTLIFEELVHVHRVQKEVS